MNKSNVQSDKLDDFNLKSTSKFDNWSNEFSQNQTKSSIASEMLHFSNYSTTSINSSQLSSKLTNTIKTTAPTSNLTLNISEGNTTSTWSSSGTGRMLPSTQNATRTIPSYLSTANSISKYKIIAGQSTASTNTSTSTITSTSKSTSTTINVSDYGSDLLSSVTYRSRLLTTITTSATDTKSNTISNSDDGNGSKSYSSRYIWNSSTNPRPILNPGSEIIDQTYKKYLTSTSTTSLTTCSSTSSSSIEGLYSTVNKTALKLSSTYHNDDLNMDDENSNNNSNYFSSKRSYLMDNMLTSGNYSPIKSSAESLDIEKPLISGPSATQLYPSRLTSLTETSGGNHSIISSSYTTGYSINYTSSLTDFSSSENPTGSLLNKLPRMKNYDFDSEASIATSVITDSFNLPITTNAKAMLNDNLASTTLADLKNSFDSYGDDSRTNINSNFASRTSTTTALTTATTTTLTTSTALSTSTTKSLSSSSPYHYRHYGNNKDYSDENVM